MFEMERRWLRYNVKSDKSRFKAEYRYLYSRKRFDREVQRAKRLYWYNFQKQLVDDCTQGNDDLWRTNGRVGVGQRAVSQWE